MPRAAALIALALCPVGAWAQEQDLNIPWRTEPSQAVQEAQSANRPILVYVLPATRNRDNRLEREQRIALNDPRVAELVQKFVPLKLSRSANREELADFGLPEGASMVMAAVSPDGKSLGQLGSNVIAQADALALQLRSLLRAYGQKRYEAEAKAVLEDPNAKPNELRPALQLVGEYGVSVADQAVVALLERRLEGALRNKVYETLAALSTKVAVDELLQRARNGDKQAAKALEQCTPAAAELLLPELQTDAEPFDYALYKTLTKICRIPGAKPQGFFKGAKPKARQAEVERASQLVKEAAQRWREGSPKLRFDEANDVTHRPPQ